MTCITVGACARPYAFSQIWTLEAVVRVFCLIVMAAALSIRVVAFATDGNGVETAVTTNIVASQR